MVSKNKILLVIAAILILVLASSLSAQGPPLGQNILVKPNPGQEAQWEAAYKEHLKWHADINDSWNWVTYQLMSGPNSGQFFIRTGGHEWADWDELGDKDMKDTANYFETAGKYAASHHIWWDRTHWNLSRLPEGGGPYKIYEFTSVKVRPDKVGDFIVVVAKYHAAFEKTSSPNVYATASTETGGRVGDFMFVGLHKSYASLEQNPADMAMMMEEVYGRQEAASIQEDFNACVEEMHSAIAVLREDLTYRAPESTSNE